MQNIRKQLWLLLATALILGATLFVSILTPTTKWVGLDSNWGWVLLFLELVYLRYSFTKLNPKQTGTLTLFGSPLYVLKPGLVFVPFGIYKAYKATANVIQIDLGEPADPEEHHPELDDTVIMLYGKDFRVTFKEEPDTKNPLRKRLTLDPNMVIRFRIDNHMRFLQEIGSLEDAVLQMGDTARSVLANCAATTTAEEALDQLREFEKQVLAAIEVQTGEEDRPLKDDGTAPNPPKYRSWGVDVLQVQLKDIGIHKSTNVALKKAANALIEKDATITVSEGEEQKLTNEGQGKANARRLFLEAEATGMGKVAEVAKEPGGEVVVLANTGRDALKNAQYTIVDGGSGLNNILAGLLETSRRTAPTETTSGSEPSTTEAESGDSEAE